jgi:hypothetical protein
MINIFYSSPLNREKLLTKFNEFVSLYSRTYSVYLFGDKGQYLERINIDYVNTNGIIIKDLQHCNLQTWELLKLLTVPKNVLIFTDNSNELYNINKIRKLLRACNIDGFLFHELGVYDSSDDIANKANQLKEYVKTNKDLLCDYAGFGHGVDFIDDLFNNKFISSKIQLIKRLLIFAMREVGVANITVSQLMGYNNKDGACRNYHTYRETDVRYQNETQKRIVKVVCDDIKYLFS